MRQKEAGSTTPGSDTSTQVNPLQPFFLVYVLDDGNVRLGFAQAKQVLTIYRELCAGVSAPYARLCDLFDAETQDGQAMQPYAHLLQRAVDAIVAGYRKRLGAALQSGRGARLPTLEEQVQDSSDFELVTWLVIVQGS